MEMEGEIFTKAVSHLPYFSWGTEIEPYTQPVESSLQYKYSIYLTGTWGTFNLQVLICFYFFFWDQPDDRKLEFQLLMHEPLHVYKFGDKILHLPLRTKVETGNFSISLLLYLGYFFLVHTVIDILALWILASNEFFPTASNLLSP